MGKSSQAAARDDGWPDTPGGIVDLGIKPFRDGRGSIRNLTEIPCGSVAVIKSKANTIRSNHWHTSDAHFLFTLEGRWMYQECALDEDINKARPVEVHVNETVYTPPRRIHRCTFLEPTVLISVSKLSRTHENHEADVVRVEER